VVVVQATLVSKLGLGPASFFTQGTDNVPHG
jgi:hypothetical protein